MTDNPSPPASDPATQKQATSAAGTATQDQATSAANTKPASQPTGATQYQAATAGPGTRAAHPGDKPLTDENISKEPVEVSNTEAIAILAASIEELVATTKELAREQSAIKSQLSDVGWAVTPNAVVADTAVSILNFFNYNHLPPTLKAVSRPFCDLASHIHDIVGPGPERTVALRKLLEAKDAAVRAAQYPGS